MVDYFMVHSFKCDGWVLIGAWAAIRTNTALRLPYNTILNKVSLCSTERPLVDSKLSNLPCRDSLSKIEVGALMVQ